MGEKFLRGLRDQLTERRGNMVWRAFSLMDRDGSENSKSGFWKFNSELWYLLEKFKYEMIFHIKYHFVNILSQGFEVYEVKNGGYKKFREKMYKTSTISGNLSTHRTIISKTPFPLLSPTPFQLFNHLYAEALFKSKAFFSKK